MRTRSRRRLDVGVLAGCSLVVGVVGAAGAAFGDTERVAGLWVRADVSAEGSAQVTEVVDYDFGGAAVDKHGIFRVIPDVSPTAPITVESDTAPDDLVVTSEAAGTRLRVGDANQTVTGRHRYTIGFPLPGVVQGTTLDWDAVGTTWEVEIEEAEIHLVTPFELRDLQCFVGSEGSTKTCETSTVEPGHVVVRVEGLSSGEGVSLEAVTGNPLAAPPVEPQPPTQMPEDKGAGLALPAAGAAAAALVAAVPARWLVRRAGRERIASGGPTDVAFASAAPVGEVRVDQNELAAMATTEFAPPKELTPAQGGIVLTETVNAEHKVAWLIEAAIAGEIELVEEGGKAVRLKRIGQSPPGTSPVLDHAFEGRDEIDLAAYDEQFAGAWGELDMQLEQWRRGSGLWDDNSEKRRTKAIVFGILGAIVGVVVVLAGAAAASLFGPGYVVLAAAGGVLAGVSLAAAVTGWELRVRTPAGSAAWLRVESFRRFLAESEAFHAEEAAKRGVLREYTAWAVATGEIDRWSRAVQASTVIPASAGLSYAYMAPLLIMSTSAASTAPSSSGGSGGGSVGGGAGGGGGGSW